MQLRERAALGVLVGAIGGGVAVLLGEAMTNKKNNRVQFEGVPSTEGINSDRFLALRLKDFEENFGEHDPDGVREIVVVFEDMVNLYESAMEDKPQEFYAWKASQYDQKIQAKIVVITKKAMEKIKTVRARIEEQYDVASAASPSQRDKVGSANPEILIKLVNLTRELRGVSSRYRERIQASVSVTRRPIVL